jgi:hypothetical protein
MMPTRVGPGCGRDMSRPQNDVRGILVIARFIVAAREVAMTAISQTHQIVIVSLL